MATLDSLMARLPNDLEALLMDPAAQSAYENMLVDRARGDIERQAGNEAQRINESAFGRGMGLSSVNAFAQAQNMQARNEALAKARIDANRATMDATRAALGQAAGYVNAQRAQNQQASQFNKQMKQQKSLANQNMIYGGVGGLAGGLAKGAGAMFAPEIKKGIKGFFGGDESKPGAQGLFGQTNTGTNPDASLPPLEADPNAITQPEIGGGGLEDLFGSNGEYNFGDVGGYGDFGIDPGDFNLDGDWGNTDLWSMFNDDWSF